LIGKFCLDLIKILDFSGLKKASTFFFLGHEHTTDVGVPILFEGEKKKDIINQIKF
jgi:hypothetical protein